MRRLLAMPLVGLLALGVMFAPQVGADESAAQELPQTELPDESSDAGMASEVGIESQQELRAAIGLDASYQHVAAVLGDLGGPDTVGPNSATAGLVLTADEKVAFDLRADVQTRGQQIAGEAIGDQFDGRFGGIWLDSSSGAANTILRIRVVGDPRALQSDIDRELPAELQGRVVVESGSTSLAQLMEQSVLLDQQLELLQGDRIEATRSSIDEREGVVRLFVATPSDEQQAQQLLANEKRLSQVVLEIDPAAATTTVNKDASVFGFVFGGQALDNGCTSAASATQPVFGNFLLTAGHCNAGLGQAVSQGGAAFGTVAVHNFGTGAASAAYDAEGITSSAGRPQSGRAHFTSTDWAHSLNWAIALNGDAIGNTVCQDGRTTTGNSGNLNPTTRCGTLVARFMDPTPGGCACVYDYAGPWFREANYAIAGGDSGATTYFDAGGFGTGAFGIQSGCFTSGSTNPCTGNAFYSHLPYVLNDWAMSLMAP